MRQSTTLFGVAINDADYAICKSKRIAGKKVMIWVCPFYQTWSNMLQRCYSKKRHTRNPSYANCSVSPEWLYFSAFKDWMILQSWEGNHLDKDILFPGNKIYGQDTCVFISPSLNRFLCDAGAIRGAWPIGVCWAKREEKFLARCCNPENGKHEFLGYYDCPDNAHHAWRKRKHKYACIYADMQTDTRVADALRVRYINYGG